MTNVNIFLQSRKTLFLFLFGAAVLSIIALTIERTAKRDKEIEKILNRTSHFEFCVQYALIATQPAYFPCYHCKDQQIFLYPGEVWKYGKTCTGPTGRYPGGFPNPNLKFVIQFQGNENQCLIQEKLKIYAYAALPEAQKRNIKLLRPPGNKIDR